jgi:transcriptional regulator with XRE-family HTH domain
MHRGPKQFRDWMRRREFNQSDAAKHFGWHESVISQYLTGERRPNLENAIQIEELTGIPAKSWLSSEDDESDTVTVSTAHKRRIHKA